MHPTCRCRLCRPIWLDICRRCEGPSGESRARHLDHPPGRPRALTSPTPTGAITQRRGTTTRSNPPQHAGRHVARTATMLAWPRSAASTARHGSPVSAAACRAKRVTRAERRPRTSVAGPGPTSARGQRLTVADAKPRRDEVHARHHAPGTFNITSPDARCWHGVRRSRVRRRRVAAMFGVNDFVTVRRQPGFERERVVSAVVAAAATHL
jgi:hypothetical protein